jgi:mRNA interferase MazF
VLSPRLYNSRTGLCLVCPVTQQAKGYAFEVLLPEGLGVQGVVLSDHLKRADWRVRQAEFIIRVPPDTLEEVRARVLPLLGG